MKGKGKIGFLDGSLQAPKTNDLAYEAWDHENSMALHSQAFSTYPLENCGWLIWRPIRIWEMQLNYQLHRQVLNKEPLQLLRVASEQKNTNKNRDEKRTCCVSIAMSQDIQRTPIENYMASHKIGGQVTSLLDIMVEACKLQQKMLQIV
ncbi:hypothetical protein AAG906_016377 [Vitis piasezkii]